METKIKISGFWTRIWALVIDNILLGIIGYIIGLTFQNFLISIGNYGMLFGLLITVTYQTICNSRLVNGQTVGKLIMGIHVVDINGNTISVGNSFLRAITLSFAYFTINISIPGVSDTAFINLLRFSVLFLLVAGIIVFYIFNKQTRQSIHDLVAGTYVAQKEENEELITLPSVTKTPFIAFGILVALVIGASLFVLNSKDSEITSMLSVYAKVSEIDGISSARINEQTTYYNGSRIKTYQALLSVKDLPENKLENDKRVRQTALLILNNVPDIDKYDAISITLNRGFNIGIASQNSTYSVSYSPRKWREILKQKKQ